MNFVVVSLLYDVGICRPLLISFLITFVYLLVVVIALVVNINIKTPYSSCYIHLPVCLRIMDPHSRAPKKNTSHGNEVLPQDTTHLIQRPCYQRGNPCQDPVGNWTTRTHVSRSSGLAKTILQGTVKGGRRQGRQRKRWEDNIREWTGLTFAKSQRAVENREKWRKLVVKSSGVPQ